MSTKQQGRPERILLGNGVFYIGETPIGLTRGGGQFVVEREVRQIEADGDRGYVKGRSVIDKSIPKLTINLLEVMNENLPSLYAGLETTEVDSGTKVTGKGQISDDDYHEKVSFVGKTKAGKRVVIEIENAINLENLDWTLADKDEVVAALTYIGCYEEESPEGYEPWSITYA